MISLFGQLEIVKEYFSVAHACGYINLNYKECKSGTKLSSNLRVGVQRKDTSISEIRAKNRLLSNVDDDGNMYGFNLFERKKRVFEMKLEAPKISLGKFNIYNIFKTVVHEK